MRLETAIELLEELKKGIDLDALPDHAEAVQLGIGAIKEHQPMRKFYPPNTYLPLPGETKE